MALEMAEPTVLVMPTQRAPLFCWVVGRARVEGGCVVVWRCMSVDWLLARVLPPPAGCHQPAGPPTSQQAPANQPTKRPPTHPPTHLGVVQRAQRVGRLPGLAHEDAGVVAEDGGLAVLCVWGGEWGG